TLARALAEVDGVCHLAGLTKLRESRTAPRSERSEPSACGPSTWPEPCPTVHEVIATAETVTGRPVPRRHTAAAYEPARLLADSTRIRSELGWRPERPSSPKIISDALDRRDQRLVADRIVDSGIARN
ncbi:MAG: hypothetical protein ACRDRS_27045, partial [Pseudonocardiaceae bacterium]